MRTLNISISDSEFKKFGLTKEHLSFTELLAILSQELQKLNLRKTVELSEKYGLSKMTMEEIDEEIKAVRKNAKNRS